MSTDEKPPQDAYEAAMQEEREKAAASDQERDVEAMRESAEKFAALGDVTEPMPVEADAAPAAVEAAPSSPMPPEPVFPDSVPPPRRREPRIPIPAPERGGKQSDIAAGIVQHAARIKPADLPDGEPGAPVYYKAHPRWGSGGAAGGPVVTTLCPGCPKAVGVPPNHMCSGSVSVDTLRGRNVDKFLVCPSFPRRLALPVMS